MRKMQFEAQLSQCSAAPCDPPKHSPAHKKRCHIKLVRGHAPLLSRLAGASWKVEPLLTATSFLLAIATLPWSERHGGDREGAGRQGAAAGRSHAADRG